MLSGKLQKKLNDQINKEFYSAYLYLSMAAYLYGRNLDGMANFFRVQAQEERDHALIMFDYLNEVGGKIFLSKIDEPDSEFESLEKLFKIALEHEQYVTKSIYEIVDCAIEERDHKTNAFLKWFIDEQVEEESTAEKNLSMIKLVGNDGMGILQLDVEMAKRVYMPPNINK